MTGNTNDYGKKGAIFGKIVLGIAIFVILLIYVYHHSHNSAPLQ